MVVYACGDVHAAYVPWPDGVSRRHWNVEPTSVPENRNDCEVVLTVPDGPPLIVVSGGPVSTEKLRVAGVGSGVPASTARTLNV